MCRSARYGWAPKPWHTSPGPEPTGRQELTAAIRPLGDRYSPNEQPPGCSALRPRAPLDRRPVGASELGTEHGQSLPDSDGLDDLHAGAEPGELPGA